MVDIEIGGNGKVSRLNDVEFRCLVAGVWPIAAKATPRGSFTIAGLPADERDVASQARRPVGAARSLLSKLRQMGMLEHDEESGLWFCHDWEEMNPAPKSDVTNAERQARYRERRNAVTNGHVTPSEGEGGR